MTADYECSECHRHISLHHPDPEKPAGSRAWRGCPDPQPLTVAQLRAILADAPDDAPVSVNFYRGDARDPLRLTVTDGEYLDPVTWGDEAGLMMQAEY